MYVFAQSHVGRDTEKLTNFSAMPLILKNTKCLVAKNQQAQRIFFFGFHSEIRVKLIKLSSFITSCFITTKIIILRCSLSGVYVIILNTFLS